MGMHLMNCNLGMAFHLVALLAAVVFCGESRADFVGTVAGAQGDAEIFSEPGHEVQGPPPHAKYEGLFYSVRKARVGDRVGNGNIVRTGVGSQVKILFEDGDQLYVAPGSSYKVEWQEGSARSAVYSLFYGSMRSVVSKLSGRKNIKVRTRDSIMGVRGTDFFVSHKGLNPRTKLVVLRGEVAMKPAAQESAKAVPVKAGTTSVATEKAPEAQTYQTSQMELNAVRRTSTILKAGQQKAPAAALEKVKELEKVAIRATVEDIKAYDPKADLTKVATIASMDALNDVSVQRIFKTAPKVHKMVTPDEIEDDIDMSAYKRYIDFQTNSTR